MKTKDYSKFPKVAIDIQGVISKNDSSEFTQKEVDDFYDAFLELVVAGDCFFGGGAGIVSEEEYLDSCDGCFSLDDMEDAYDSGVLAEAINPTQTFKDWMNKKQIIKECNGEDYCQNMKPVPGTENYFCAECGNHC